MSKSLNLSKVLLASLAPIIAHQTTYGMIIQQQPQQQQVDETPILLQGVNLIQNPVAMPNNNAFVNGVAAGMLAAIPQNAQSGVFVAIAKWKTELANAQNQNPLVWNNLGRGVLANAQNNNSAELQRVVNAFNTAVVINTDPANGQQALNLAQIKQAYNNNQGYTQNIYTPLATLAKSLYEFRKSDQQWNDLDNLKKLYMIIIAEQHFDPGQGNVQIDQAQNIHKEYLQQVLSDAIDEFVSSLNKWKFEAPVLFSQRQANNAHDTQPGIDKFKKFKEETLKEWDEFVSLDQFYQFSNTQAHLADLNTLEPIQFMNPNILNTHIAVGNNLLCNKIANYVGSRIEDLTILDDVNEPLNQQRQDALLNLVDGAQFSINKYVRTEEAAIEAQKGDTFNVNQQIGQNFSRATIDALHNKIVDILAGEVHATPKMVQDYLDKQNNQNPSVFDGILTLQLNNYANINTIDDLADAVVDAFHNDGQNHRIQDLTGTPQNPGPLFAYKVSDSDYVKKSLQQIQGQDNPNYDPKIEAEIKTIMDTCLDAYQTQIHLDQMYITQPITNKAEFIEAIKTNYPRTINDQRSLYLSNKYSKLMFLNAILLPDSQNLTSMLLKTTNSDDINDLMNLSLPDLAAGIHDLHTIAMDTTSQEFTDTYTKNDQIQINFIQKTPNAIAQNDELVNALKQSNEFKLKLAPELIEANVQSVLNNNQLKEQVTNQLITSGTLIKKDADSIATAINTDQNLRNNLSSKNNFNQFFIKNDENTIYNKYSTKFVKRNEFNDINTKLQNATQRNKAINEVKSVIQTKSNISNISDTAKQMLGATLKLHLISDTSLQEYKSSLRRLEKALGTKQNPKPIEQETDEAKVVKLLSTNFTKLGALLKNETDKIGALQIIKAYKR